MIEEIRYCGKCSCADAEGGVSRWTGRWQRALTVIVATREAFRVTVSEVQDRDGVPSNKIRGVGAVHCHCNRPRLQIRERVRVLRRSYQRRQGPRRR